MKRRSKLALLIVVVLSVAFSSRNGSHGGCFCEAYRFSSFWPYNKPKAAAAATVAISPQCAAVIVASGTAVAVSGGSLLAYIFLSPTAAVLLAAGIYVANTANHDGENVKEPKWWWWQSTKPVAKNEEEDSLYAQLQALSKAAGTTNSTAIVAVEAVGGAVSAMLLKEFCDYVDESSSSSDPDKNDDGTGWMATVFHTMHRLIIRAHNAQEMCAASRACTSLTDAAVQAKDVALDWMSTASSALQSTMETIPEISSAWNSVKEGAGTLKEKVEGSEWGIVAAESMSSAWTSLKAGAFQLKINAEILFLQEEIKKTKHEFGAPAFEYLLLLQKHAMMLVPKTTDCVNATLETKCADAAKLEEIFDASLEKVKAIENEREELLRKHPGESVQKRRLDHQIGHEKEEFGTLAFDHFLVVQESASPVNKESPEKQPQLLDDHPQLKRIFEEKLEYVRKLEGLLEKQAAVL